MGYVIKMPKLGLEMKQGTVLEWVAETGEEVSDGEKIAEVESEKSIGEIEAREDGVLRRIYVEVDESVPPGTPIGILAAPDADISDLEAEAEAELEADTEEAAEPESTTAGTDANATDGEPSASQSVERTTEVRASPRAQKHAEELGVDLANVEGTGPQGAITAADVETAGESVDESAESVKASPRAKKRAEELGVDLATVEGTGPQGALTAADVEAAGEATSTGEGEASGIRRIVSEQSDVYRYERATAVADPAAATALLETTEAVRSAFEERVTVTDVLLVVASATLADRPAVNATYAEATHQLQETQNVALATDVEGDVVAGVVPDVRSQSLTDIVEARRELSDDAGGDQPTFTLANAADAASDGLLVNPPGVASLEVDPSGQRAVPNGDSVDLQPLVTASLTYDTRAIGGAEAEAFLERFFEQSEQASELVLTSYRGKE